MYCFINRSDEFALGGRISRVQGFVVGMLDVCIMEMSYIVRLY